MIGILSIMLVPPIILSLVGKDKLKNGKKRTALIYFILAGVYFLIGLGVCGSLFFA